MSFFQRRHTDPEWFQQFPQRINRLGDNEDHLNLLTKFVNDQEDKHVPQDNNLLKNKEDGEVHGQESYTNPTFEASASLGRNQSVTS